MGTYASTSDLQPRLAGRTIGASTKPTTTEVGVWITDAEAQLTGVLNAIGVGTPVTDSNGIAILKSWACDYAEGRVRRAWNAEEAGAESDDGKALIDGFEARLKDMITNPGFYAAMLNAGDGAASSRVQAYVLSNDDDKTIEDGDFGPLVDSDTEF